MPMYGSHSKGKNEPAAPAKPGLKMKKQSKPSKSVSPLTKGKAKARTKGSGRMFGRSADTSKIGKGYVGLKGMKF